MCLPVFTPLALELHALCPVCCPFAVFCLMQLLRSELGPHACTTIPLQTEPSPGPPPRPPHGSASLFHCLTPPCLHSCSITPLSPLRTFANGPCPFSSFSSCLDDLPSSSLSSSQRFPLVSPPRLLFKNRNPLSWHLHLSFASPPPHCICHLLTHHVTFIHILLAVCSTKGLKPTRTELSVLSSAPVSSTACSLRQVVGV